MTLTRGFSVVKAAKLHCVRFKEEQRKRICEDSPREEFCSKGEQNVVSSRSRYRVKHQVDVLLRLEPLHIEGENP